MKEMLHSDTGKLWGRRIGLILLDLLIMTAAGLLALLIRFEFDWSAVDSRFIAVYMEHLPVHLVITVAVFWLLRLYHSLWLYASMTEAINTCIACALVALTEPFVIWMFGGILPRSYYPLSFVFSLIGTAGMRLGYRYLRTLRMERNSAAEKEMKNIMVIGGGVAGTMLIREIKESRFINGKVCCVIDDNKSKHGFYVNGVRIVGDRNTILENAEKYRISLIILAMPSQSGKTIKGILDICKKTECELKILPGIYQLVNGDVQVSQLRDVEINDLLGRDPIVINMEGIQEQLKGKTVLVTGGGGSIGSELCRQIAACCPKQLIIFDIYENNAYDIQQELVHQYPELNLVVLIGSVRNTKRINDVFATYRPEIVYHAAAHKHVPLMETSPDEAIKNNVLGTWKTVQAAHDWGVERFVLISTDKAVNPTNIMGASKRLCEMIIQTYNGRSASEFVAVRFGNVLGSNGSVIPLFKKQIENGGPVTVTHPDIIRYFMTIPEAVSLVLEAGLYAKGGEIFVLDMGEPVKILDLAKNLIRLSGLKPEEDIEIVFTGLRPGEKLFEELLMDEEGLQVTDNKMIHIGKPIEFDEDQFLLDLEELKIAAESETKNIREMVQKMVSTYKPGE